MMMMMINNVTEGPVGLNDGDCQKTDSLSLYHVIPGLHERRGQEVKRVCGLSGRGGPSPINISRGKMLPHTCTSSGALRFSLLMTANLSFAADWPTEPGRMRLMARLAQSGAQGLS